MVQPCLVLVWRLVLHDSMKEFSMSSQSAVVRGDGTNASEPSSNKQISCRIRDRGQDPLLTSHIKLNTTHRRVGRCPTSFWCACRTSQFQVLVHGPTFNFKSRLAFSNDSSDVPNTVTQGYGNIATNPCTRQQHSTQQLGHTQSRYSNISQTVSQPPRSRADLPGLPNDRNWSQARG